MNQEPIPQDEMMNNILYKIKRYENNQMEFKNTIDDFIITSNEILGNEAD